MLYQNIILVKFDEIREILNLSKHEDRKPITCKSCTAILTIFNETSIIQTEHDKKFIWRCEFCLEENDISLLIEALNDIPKHENVAFIINESYSKIKQPVDTNVTKNDTFDDSYLVLCIDVR